MPTKPYDEMTLEEIQEALQAPTPVEVIEWKPHDFRQYGNVWTALAFPHTDARFPQNRLDEVCGTLNWQTDSKVNAGLVLVGVGIRVPGTENWVWKWDTGQDEPQVSTKGYGGGRGLFSQGFKRTCFQFGIGRDLYDMPTPRCRVKAYMSKGQRPRLKEWIDDPWSKSESPETGRVHPSRVDEPEDFIRARSTSFWDIAYGKLKIDKDQGIEIIRSFYDEENDMTDWAGAIMQLETQLPPEDRLFTKQESAKTESEDEDGSAGQG